MRWCHFESAWPGRSCPSPLWQTFGWSKAKVVGCHGVDPWKNSKACFFPPEVWHWWTNSWKTSCPLGLVTPRWPFWMNPPVAWTHLLGESCGPCFSKSKPQVPWLSRSLCSSTRWKIWKLPNKLPWKKKQGEAEAGPSFLPPTIWKKLTSWRIERRCWHVAVCKRLGLPGIWNGGLGGFVKATPNNNYIDLEATKEMPSRQSKPIKTTLIGLELATVSPCSFSQQHHDQTWSSLPRNGEVSKASPCNAVLSDKFWLYKVCHNLPGVRKVSCDGKWGGADSKF